MRPSLCVPFVFLVACSDSGGAGGSPPSDDGGATSPVSQSASASGGKTAASTVGSSSAGGTTSGGNAACPASAVFCESFEGDTLDAARWGNEVPAGLALDKTMGWEGSHSLHAFMGSELGVVDPHQVELLVPIPAPDDRIYARWFMRFENLSLPGYHPNFVTVVSSDFDIGSWPMFEQHSFGSFAGSFSVNHLGPQLDQAMLWGGFDAEGPWHGDDTPDTEHTLNAGEWFCVELMVYGGDQGPGDTSHADEETVVWINGEAIDDLHASHAVWPSPEHWSPRLDGSRWSFGIGGAYTADVVTNVWYDAIAFGHERIGCGGSP